MGGLGGGFDSNTFREIDPLLHPLTHFTFAKRLPLLRDSN